ncbi:hypothetical protein Tco_1422307 [Tanacetum coccineum]
MLLDIEKLIKVNRTLLNSSIFPHEEMSMRVLLAKERILKLIQVWDEEQIKPWSFPELLFQLSNDSQTIAEILKQREEKHIEHDQAANLEVQKEQEEQAAQSFTLYWNFPMIDDDEQNIQYRLYLERSSKAITPDLSTEELDNSLSIWDEHLDTISETESDEVIKSSVEDLVPIPRINKVSFDQEGDIRRVEKLLNNSPPLDVSNDYFEIFSDSNDDYTSSDVDSFEDINYVEASPPDSELISLEEVEDVILREKLLNINLLIAKIESLNNNPIPDCVLNSCSSSPIPVEDSDSFFEETETSLSYTNNSLPELEIFSNHTEETRSGSTTYHADICLPKYDSFHYEIGPDSGDLISSVMDDIFERNEDNYFDPEGDEIDTSPNVDADHYFPFTFVIRIFLPYLTYPKDSSLLLSCENEDTIFDPGIFAYIFYSYKPDYPDFEGSRAWCFVYRSLDLQILSMLILEI